MSRVPQWVALGCTYPWSCAQCPVCGPRSGLAKGHSVVLAEILSRAHVLRPDHTYPRRGRAAAPGLCPRPQPDVFLRASNRVPAWHWGLPPADWGSGKTARRPLRMGGGEEAASRAGAYIGYFHLCVEDCRHLQIWGSSCPARSEDPSL